MFSELIFSKIRGLLFVEKLVKYGQIFLWDTEIQLLMRLCTSDIAYFSVYPYSQIQLLSSFHQFHFRPEFSK